MINEILESLGFNSEEIDTYLNLLEAGPATAGNLAKMLALPRPTLYGYLSRLHQKGLVVQTLNLEGVKIFSAASPDSINTLFDTRIQELKSQQDTYQTLLEELRSKSSLSLSTPRFQLFEGKSGLEHVLKDMLLYRNLITYSFWPIKAMIDTLSPAFFEYLNRERIKNNLYTKAIWPMSQIVDIKEHPYLGSGEPFKREIRIAPSSVSFSMGYWVYANKAAFISSKKEGFGFIIESPEMVEMLMAQHEVVWGMSEALPDDSAERGESFLKSLQ